MEINELMKCKFCKIICTEESKLLEHIMVAHKSELYEVLYFDDSNLALVAKKALKEDAVSKADEPQPRKDKNICKCGHSIDSHYEPGTTCHHLYNGKSCACISFRVTEKQSNGG